jgi:glycosyltransferase involved in cell wall biosynthesis
MAPYFERTTVVVVPILTGAGIRVKIIEAMAARRAIVSTSMGAEGLAYVSDREHLLIADDPTDFAHATVRLLRNGALRERLAAQARAVAEREYDLGSLGRRLEAALARCTSR